MGNITIKGGTVRAYADSNESSLGYDCYGIGNGGLGYSQYNPELYSGMIYIYDSADVEASGIYKFDDIVYIHSENGTYTEVSGEAVKDYFNVVNYDGHAAIRKKGGTVHSITVQGSSENGTLSISGGITSAGFGEKVELIIEPVQGYRLASGAVKNSKGQDVKVYDSYFIMPDEDVTVNAVFEQKINTATFNAENGVLTLSGNVNAEDLREYSKKDWVNGGVKYDDSPVLLVECEEGTVLPADCYSLFGGFNRVKVIDLSNADTSQVRLCMNMFDKCYSLETIYVGSTWSSKNIYDDDDMFWDCDSIKGGNGTDFDSFPYEPAEIDTAEHPGYLTVKPVITEPVKKTLIYTGEEQELVTAGTTDYGSLLYSLSGEGSFSSDVPKASEAGTYTVYYKYDGTGNNALALVVNKIENIDIHRFSYTADSATVTASCIAGECTLTDNKAELSIIAPKISVYGDGKSAEATLSGLDAFNNATLLNIDEASIRYVGRNGTAYAESASAPFTAGEYTAKITISSGSGEEAVTASVDYEINKAELTITANSGALTYGDKFEGFGVGYSGFVNGDDESCLSGEQTYACNYVKADKSYGDVGDYQITVSGLSSDNYDIVYNPGTLTVNPKEITVTADSAEKTYGEDDPELTFKVSGLVGNDELNGKPSREEGEDVGVYRIIEGAMVEEGVNPNYTIK